MDTADVQVGSTITNGSSALRITERVERDPRWGTPSWRGLCIPLEAFGGNAGMSDTVPDYLLGSWRHVPFEWTPVTGGALEERYVWTPDWRRLQREVRPRPLAVGEAVRFRDDNGGGEGVGVVVRAEDGKVWVETLVNMWRGADPAWFVRTSDPIPEGLEFWPPRAVQPTVDGIRGHRVDTPEEAELRRTLALQDTIGADQVLRLLTEDQP